MAHFKRKKLFVDPKVQGLLVLRVIIYWVACMVTLELVRLTWLIATGPEQPTFAAYFLNHDWRAVGGRLLVASVLLVPIIWDMLTFSNRFAGPIYRMRRILRETAQGGPIERVQLREGDYWHGLADDLNAAFEQLAPERVEHLEAVAERVNPAGIASTCTATPGKGRSCCDVESEDGAETLSSVR